MKSVRVGLAGCGFAGSIHSRSLILAKGSSVGAKLNVELVVAADTDSARAKTVAQQYGWKHTETDWRKIFKHDINLLIIATPNNEHAKIVRQAADQGITVLLEKPVTRTYEEALALRSVVNPDLVRVGYVNRFVPAVQQAKLVIGQGKIGTIRTFRSVYLLNMRQDGQKDNWRFIESLAGGGASDDLGSHHLDILEFLLGKVDTVQATSRIWDIANAPPVTNDDATNALLTLDNDAIGTLCTSRTSPGHSLTGYIEIEGSEGALKIDRAFLNELFYRDQSGSIIQLNARPAEPFVTMWASSTVQGAHPFSWYDCFAFQMAEMLMLVSGEKPETTWSASLDDGVRAMATTHAIMESARDGSIRRPRENFRG